MWMSAKKLKTYILTLAIFLLGASAFAQDLKLNGLIEEALKNNPDIRASQAKIEAARHRIPQLKSLPDPMFMFCYQNEGFDRYT
jgi:cobalt-zinc-cadmium efflux system outer membrane protein